MGVQAVSADTASPLRSGSAKLPEGKFYVDVDDFRMHCHVQGDGPLLIHQTGIWTFSSIDTLASINAELARYFTVLTMDCRGQGGSTLGNGPTTYSRAAVDTVRMMDALGIDNAHFFGISDGGCIQLELLLDFDDRVRSSTLCATPYSHDAYSPETRKTFERWRVEMLSDSEVFYGLSEQPLSTEVLAKMRENYAAVSPHPEKFIEVLKGQRRCWATEPDISLRRLSAVRRPVLIVKAGADEFIAKEAFDALESAIPGSQAIFFGDMSHNPQPHIKQVVDAMERFITNKSHS